MWKINCDVIFLLVFLIVTINCSSFRDDVLDEFHDSTSFDGSDWNSVSHSRRIFRYGNKAKTKLFNTVKYNNKFHLSDSVNKIDSESEAEESFNGYIFPDAGSNSISPHDSQKNQLRTTQNLIKDDAHSDKDRTESYHSNSLCSNGKNCEKRLRRSISNSPQGGSKIDEYQSQLLSDDGNETKRKKGRQLNVESSIDDIIHGIMKLLGGSVKITATETTPSLKTSEKMVLKTRINNRGPPRLPDIPFGIPAFSGLTRPLIRPPVTMSKNQAGLPFNLNTRPPFPVPFPPKLFQPPSKKPFLNGIPLPINILPDSDRDSSSENDRKKINSIDSVTESSEPITEPNENTIKNISSVKVASTPPIILESSINQEYSDKISEAITKTTAIVDMPASPTTKPPPNLTVKFSLATTTEPKIKVPSQGMVIVTTPTKITSSSTTFSYKPIPGVRATGIVQPADISPEDLAHPSIPTRLPDPIVSYRPVGHRGTVLPDSTFPLNEVITAAAATNKNIFDVTVSAIQGYNIPTRPTLQRPVRPGNPLITSASKSNDGVFIDGRKTFFDLQPGKRPVQTVGVGTVIPEKVQERPYFHSNRPAKMPVPGIRPTLVKKPVTKAKQPSHRPTLGPPKRIDTCIVGYDNTCKKELREVCRTEGDVSSCFCRPGTGRRRQRTKCQKSIVLQLSLKVDKVGDRRISWNGNYANPEAREYQILSYEAEKALDSAFTRTPGMTGLYLGCTINKFYSLGGNVIVNSTIQLLRTPQTSSTNIRRSLQRHLIRVIQANKNYIGKSVLAVEGHLNPIPDVSDVNECFDTTLNDCHSHAECTNVFGSFMCTCRKGYTDRNVNNVDESGRLCLSCSRDFCSKRGNCTIENEEKVCTCDSSFYGNRCEIDGEVISVAVGASVVAIIIILLTLILLCWKSRQWKAEDRRAQILNAAGGFFGWRGRSQPESAYSMNMRTKGGNPAYGAMMEDHIRWSQMAESLAQQNIYAQPEQMRPAVYAEPRKMPLPPSEYGSVGTLAHQQFGMHCMNPPPFLPVNTGGPNSLSQFTSTSINAASLSGISRAPTLGARTPQPIRDSGGMRTFGPFGGGIAVKYHRDGMSQDSSEEDDRPYHLPRPKSRGSLADASDYYFEPDDLMTRYPPIPTSPPPAVPHFPTRLY